MKAREIKFSKNLQKLRKKLGYKSAYELSIALQDVGYYCSLSSIKSLESGHRNPTIDAIAALCSVLNISADDLLF